jgi:hypothetical protein
MATERTRLYGDVPATDAQGELSPAKFAAIGLLLAGRPYADVAREVGIDTTTLYRWREEPAFAAELLSQFALMREATVFGLFSLASDSITALRSALKSQNETARVSAARTVLDRLGIRAVGDAPGASTSAATESELETCVRAVLRNEFQGLDDRDVLSRIRALLDRK